LDEFIDDLFGWALEEFGLIPTLDSVHEKTYESNIVVKADSDLCYGGRSKRRRNSGGEKSN
jgi:hypothetical protein